MTTIACGPSVARISLCHIAAIVNTASSMWPIDWKNEIGARSKFDIRRTKYWIVQI